jgi:ubiquinol-cytochrome c reductase cytochrome b subunit
VKDTLYFVVFFFGLLFFSLTTGYYFMDAENFIPANPLVTPVHIQPEWYFLFAYAILRSIPNKLGGVAALLASILVLFLFPIVSRTTLPGVVFSPSLRVLFWCFVANFAILT